MEGAAVRETGLAALARQPAPPVLAPPGFAPAPGPLAEAQQQEAVDWTNARYDEMSIRVIQHIAGAPMTGTFDAVTAQAVATFQRTRGLLVDGKVGHQTLTASFPETATHRRLRTTSRWQPETRSREGSTCCAGTRSPARATTSSRCSTRATAAAPPASTAPRAGCARHPASRSR